jgi:hypothetical protein
MRLVPAILALHAFSLPVKADESSRPDEPEPEFKVPAHAEALLESYCYECHDSGIKKGGIRLDNLGELGEGARLELLNTALEHVFSGEMPPKDADQPDAAERDKLAQWMWGDLKARNASKLEDKLRYYKYANYISHQKLFSGEITDKPSTRARRWRVNELIYNERINDVFELEGKNRKDSFFGVVKPFNLPKEPGVAYYDTEIVEGGQFLTLLSNAKWVVDKQLRDALVKSGEFQFSKDYLEAKADKKRGFNTRFPDEVWNPGRTAEPLARVILSSGAPTDEMLAGAITHQFRVALQRDPGPPEMAKYIGFTKETLKVSDKTSALKKMMVSVLMEPEFLYRNEFGGGTPDEDGRLMLTPREASYAISYALTDRIPDAELVDAAQSGKLATRADYEREVRRILADDSIPKPRILRFFQDYFGYKGIYDVFKDEERFVGAYNPHRVVASTYIYRVPGKISKEADLLVEWVLDRDREVFETLLTTDRYFVHHTGDNGEMRRKTEDAQRFYSDLRKIYLAVKDAKGRDHLRILREIGLAKGYVKPARDGGKEGLVRKFGIDMKMAETFFGKDGSKRSDSDGNYLPQLGEAVDHSAKMYNLDHTTWDYVVEQPFQVPNRIGMLTHPAWLVSNSHNAATDPIRRGKWIREKLLGGFIRDVPITVDAKVPENPDQTLRERFAVSEQSKCWQCHEKMNPLGYVFESYDDFGRFRVEEMIEYPENVIGTRQVLARTEHGTMGNYSVNQYKTKPVNTAGFLEGTGDKSLDGPVKDVPDMIHRLAKSDRVRQVFIRNVFRYFMGRNETLSDSQTLIEADRVYLASGGSFKELMVSLLTSDSFIYRK